MQGLHGHFVFTTTLWEISMKKALHDASVDSDFLRGQAEAAKYARVSRRCVSDWQARRIIPFIKVGRKCVLFRKSDLTAALRRFEVPAIG